MNQIVVLSTQELLREMESMAVEAAAKVMSGRDELAIAVHKIYSEKLYLAEKDEKGFPVYPNQAAYEPHLLEKLGVSRATLYNAYTPAKLACGPTFELDYEQFVESGGVITWAGVKDNVQYNGRTGEVKALKAGDLPEDVDLKDHILKAVENVRPVMGKAELNLRPGDVRKELDKTLSNGKKPIVTFSRKVRDDGSRVTMYSMEKDGQTFIGTMTDPQLPHEVEAEYRKRLKIY
jgi:DNA-binding phage protein